MAEVKAGESRETFVSRIARANARGKSNSESLIATMNKSAGPLSADDLETIRRVYNAGETGGTNPGPWSTWYDRHPRSSTSGNGTARTPRGPAVVTVDPTQLPVLDPATVPSIDDVQAIAQIASAGSGAAAAVDNRIESLKQQLKAAEEARAAAAAAAEPYARIKALGNLMVNVATMLRAQRDMNDALGIEEEVELTPAVQAKLRTALSVYGKLRASLQPHPAPETPPQPQPPASPAPAPASAKK